MRILFLLRYLLPMLLAGSFYAHAIEPQTLGSTVLKMNGASVYVPLYSHIYFGDSLKPFNLAGVISVRNTDSDTEIELLKASYYGSDGVLIREFLEKPLVIKKLASHSFKVKESDVAGGSGASVSLKWRSTRAVSAPLIESVMIGTAFGQGISFTSRGQITSFEDSSDSEGSQR